MNVERAFSLEKWVLRCAMQGDEVVILDHLKVYKTPFEA